MIYGKFIQWAIRLTHEPTGISVETDSTCFRSESLARNALLLRLKSKVYAMKGYEPDNVTKFSYTIHEGYVIDNLEDVKKEVQ